MNIANSGISEFYLVVFFVNPKAICPVEIKIAG